MSRILLITALFFVLKTWSQDTLYFKDSKKTAVLLLETGADNVKYKRFDNQAGPAYTVLKSDLLLIAFSDGKKEVFNQNPPVKSDSLTQNTAGKIQTSADTIYFKSGKITPSKVILISDADIKYKLSNYLDGPTYQAGRAEIKEILFSNGMMQQFNDLPKAAGNENPLAARTDGYTMYMKGKDEAMRNFNPRGAKAVTGVLAAFPVYGIAFGLVPALVFSNTKPKNLSIPTEYAKNKEYVAGYTDWAGVMKKRKVWRTYGASATISLLVVLTLLYGAGGI